VAPFKAPVAPVMMIIGQPPVLSTESFKQYRW